MLLAMGWPAGAQDAPAKPVGPADVAATPLATSQPAPKLHCVILNEASGAAPRAEIIVYTVGPAGWMPIGGEATGQGGVVRRVQAQRTC